MTYLIYTFTLCTVVLFVYGMLTGAEEKASEPAPQDEPHDEHPDIAPDIYARALVYLLVEAELRALELAQPRGDDESGKGARV